MSVNRANREVETLLWTAPDFQQSVEIPWVLLEEVHGSVQEGFRRLSRGGVEVGGVLFGRRSDQLVRVLAWRPMPCEHSRGPGFLLSNSDKQALMQVLEGAESDPRLKVLEPVGWFVSHTRQGLVLTDEDVDIFNRYFPEPWQTTLVLHPDKSGKARAGFFLRDRDGKLRTDATPREFQIEAFRIPSPVEPAPTPAASRAPRTPAFRTPDSSREAKPGRPPSSPPPYARPWRIAAIAAALLVCALAVSALPRLRPPQSPVAENLQLRLLDAQGQLRIEWDRNHPAIQGADGATLQISDGGAIPPIKLDRDTTQRGSVTYLRLSEDVTVRLLIDRHGHPPLQELARYVGPPVPKVAPKELRQARETRQKYLSETKALRQRLDMETERTRDLERAVKRLEDQIEKEAKAR